ncbi:hypothetical protein EUGRSUZ_F02690 [Eucalyptus grandis]|uniref:Uncharacterized protein n=2 Tax=Eucalyptus grandis TaxID=71139 RepID=A0ACC3KKF8_EUCGR|nr:hypothetical protein EUGRSUZ_F02690 [Eucalyptus grandis]
MITQDINNCLLIYTSLEITFFSNSHCHYFAELKKQKFSFRNGATRNLTSSKQETTSKHAHSCGQCIAPTYAKPTKL